MHSGRQGTGRFFESLLGPLGANRSIYAPDLPGCGESDGAGAGAGSEQYALALTDLLDSLRQRQVDILAHAEGVETAVAMEKMRPHALVRRLACIQGSPQALETVRSLKIAFRELSPDGAPEQAPQTGPMNLQLSELIEFFGSGPKT